jgi:hypothetical protein
MSATIASLVSAAVGALATFVWKAWRERRAEKQHDRVPTLEAAKNAYKGLSELGDDVVDSVRVKNPDHKILDYNPDDFAD